MKVMISGKGGCGKSTITTLLARALTRKGKKVLVVDADESNLCLHRLLGAEQPEIMMDAMGGRQGSRERLKQAANHHHQDEFFKESMTIGDLPGNCLTEVDGIKLLVVGKIKSFGEGCACMIGGISRAVLSRLHEEKDEIVLIDAEAGLEHFGRRIDGSCDLILAIIDPSYESIQMADRTRKIAEAAGVQAYFILNKVDDLSRQAMVDNLDGKRIIASLPKSDDLFLQNLKGEPLQGDYAPITDVCNFVIAYRQPVKLTLSL
jgi:CO dehydrogenase maturation factor